MDLGQQDILKRYHLYEQLADVSRLGAAEIAAAAGNGGNGDTKAKNRRRCRMYEP